MKKIKIFALCALMVVTMGLAVGCTSKNGDNGNNNNATNGNSDNKNTNGNNNENNSKGGVLDDIGDDIEKGMDNIGNDLKNGTDGKTNTNNGNR